METLARWICTAALVFLTFLGPGTRRAEAVINPLFRVPFGVNPYFRIRPGLTIGQAAYNITAVGQAYARFPPYALGYNPYVATYAMPAAFAYSPGYAYPGIGSYYGYADPYMPAASAYGARPLTNPYLPRGLAGDTGPSKGIDRLGGLANADGSLAWPLGLRVLPPAVEIDKLRQQISAEVRETLNGNETGKADRASAQQASRDIDRLEALLNERALDVPLTDQAVTDARRFLHRLKDRLKGLSTSGEGAAPSPTHPK